MVDARMPGHVVSPLNRCGKRSLPKYSEEIVAMTEGSKNRCDTEEDYGISRNILRGRTGPQSMGKGTARR